MAVKNPKTENHSFMRASWFVLLAFSEGAAVMSLELIGSRMIAPVFGASLTVWTTVLGITMAALALGYFLGSKLALRKDAFKILNYLFIIGAALILVMPRIAQSAIHITFNDSLLISVLLSSILFLFIPIAVLGATTPLLVKYSVNQEITQGKASGKIYGASTIGGIIFTFIVGFWLVPSFGLSLTALFIAVLITIIPVVILAKQKKKLFLSIPLVFILVGITISSNNSKTTGIKIIHQSEGLLGQLLVVDHIKDNSGSTDRILFVNRMGQTWIDRKTGNSIWTYPNYIAVLASGLKEEPDVLILGIGGGTVANVLVNTVNANIEAVELDKRIGDIAKNNFNLKRSIKVTIDDARHYLRTTDKKFDLIVFDVFKGEVPPAHVLTVECFSDVKKNLNPHGCLIINFNGFLEGEQGKAGRSIVKTLNAAGYDIQIFPTYGSDSERNILYVASIDKIDFNNTRLHLNLYNRQVNIDSLKFPVEKIKFQEGDLVLSDDFPVLDILNKEAAKIWRNAYNEDYTKKYSEKGIPIFK